MGILDVVKAMAERHPDTSERQRSSLWQTANFGSRAGSERYGV
jgi:hypothetical protein